MQRGQRESVSRGQPRGGLVFSHDLSRGLSDHLGTKPGFWLIWLNLSKTNQAAPAAYVKAIRVEDFEGRLAVQNLLTDLGDAARAEGIRFARPAQGKRIP